MLFVLDAVRGMVMAQQAGMNFAITDTLHASRGIEPDSDVVWFDDVTDDEYFMDWFQANVDAIDMHPDRIRDSILVLWRQQHRMNGLNEVVTRPQYLN
jgi:hypothetical protein